MVAGVGNVEGAVSRHGNAGRIGKLCRSAGAAVAGETGLSSARYRTDEYRR